MPTYFIPSPLAPIIAKLLAEPEVENAAEEAANWARDHCPVDTGELQDSIEVIDGPEGGKRIIVGTDHWIYPEFGTSSQAAQPFLRPSVDAVGLHR